MIKEPLKKQRKNADSIYFYLTSPLCDLSAYCETSPATDGGCGSIKG